MAISSLVARRLSPVTLVEHQLEELGVSTDTGADPLAAVRTGDAMSAPAVCVPAQLTVAEGLAAVASTPHRCYPVVDADGRLLGLIDREALEDAPDHQQRVATRLRSAPVVATPREPLDNVSYRLGDAGETRCPVVDSLQGLRVVGFVTPSDLLRARVRATSAEVASGFEPLGG